MNVNQKSHAAARLANIHADLQAYSKGWISYDAGMVRVLQEERARIITGNCCPHCFGPKPVGQSCDCFDNGCQ